VRARVRASDAACNTQVRTQVKGRAGLVDTPRELKRFRISDFEFRVSDFGVRGGG
jgi:hypothetical protein